MRLRRFPEAMLLCITLLAAMAFFAQAAKDRQERGSAGEQQPAVPASSDAGSKSSTQMELETVRDYDQRLLSTVHWALGGVFLLVALVGGLNWFTSFRLYERERDSLRESSKLASLEEATKLRGMFNDLREQTARDFERINSFAHSFEAKMDESARSRDEGLRQEFRAAVKSQGEASKMDLLKTEYHNTRLRAQFYLSQKRGGACLSTWVEHLAVLESLGWLDGTFLELALSGIEEAAALNSAIDYSTHAGLLKYLEKAPNVMASRVSKLKSLLDQLRHV